MNKIRYILILTLAVLVSSCNDWLNILPDNEQTSGEYWKTKEDVQAVLSSGYYYMRQCTPDYIDWGELRAGSIILGNLTKDNVGKYMLQNFNLTSSISVCQWSTEYQVINMANSVIYYADAVESRDATYTDAAMKSHKTEAYFMRALMYFYLVRNFKEVPIILTPYVDDSTPYDRAKSTEEEIIKQIKADITTALETGAAKESYDQTWENKGRATKWSLYALMADVCLWSEDYDNCIIYANYLIEATTGIRPVFISEPSKWFEIFYPGNSNESIFELNWDYASYQETSRSPSGYFGITLPATYKYSEPMMQRLTSETFEAGEINAVRSYFGAYYGSISNNIITSNSLIWKYWGVGYQDANAIRPNSDANFIIYRMADVMLMKAEAMVLKGNTYWEGALAIVNQIRNRSNLQDLNIDLTEATELSMLELILSERDMELAAEGKRWYDLMRLGKCKNFVYKDAFIEHIVLNNESARPEWIRSVLKSEYAWYLPIHEDEIKRNKLLEQNPYYKTTN